MKLTDAQSAPLGPRGKKAATVEVLLVSSERQALHTGLKLPKLPESFRGIPGDKADLPNGSSRIVAVGCGKPGDFDSEARFWEAAGAAAFEALRALRIESAALAVAPKAKDPQAAMNAFALGATLASYRCTAFRSSPPKGHFAPKSLQLPADLWKGTERARRLGESVNWSRALVDAPANLMTPQGFVAAAKEDLKAPGLRIQVLDRKMLEKLGAGGLLAVGRGSEHPPCMLILEWSGKRSKEIDLGLVGKGLTFDGGGLNLKPYPGISKMKFDMAGAAAVAGAMRALAKRKAPLNVVAAIPLCENVIDGTAYRPGDVITSLSGLTIEVDNTDAEGRIVLADAMSYLIDTFQPQRLVDVATLTGSIMASLHEEHAGLFSSDEALATELSASGTDSGERLWRMPLTRHYDYTVESEIADVRNIGSPGMFGASAGSAIAAAKFLEKFAGGTRWAHLDIAGTAWASRPVIGIPKGPTGFGVRLIDAFVDRIAAKG
ncbi:MAG TPA: leucyl aminopeptidase [Solimonas sp.]